MRVKLIVSFLLLCLMFISISPLYVAASDYTGPEVQSSGHETQSTELETQSIGITVVVPRNEGDTTPAPPAVPDIPLVFPVHVWESNENGRREIVRVYELREHESPAYIPRESFERDGFFFQFAEMIRREMPVHSSREHVETVTVTTQTNDLATILALLNPTLEFVSDDGHFGVLTLDVATIRIESQGTRSSSHAVTRTREFPHLSNTDTALIPRSITENGRTYNLTNVDWQAQGSTAVDYTQIATSFTAVATFTGSATRTTTIGYTTTAEYRGQISKITAGRTEYTAYFIGIPIVTPTIDAVQGAATGADVSVGTGAGTDVGAGTGVGDGAEGAGMGMETAYQNSLHYADEAASSHENDESGVSGQQRQMAHGYLEPTAEASKEGASESDSFQEQQRQSSGVPWPVTILLVVVGAVIAFFVGKKGKAMLASIRKTACLLLCVGFTFGTIHQVHAFYLLPNNVFGAQSTNEVHINPQANSNSATHANQTMHFAPNATPSPSMHFNPQYAPHIAPHINITSTPRDSPAARDSPAMNSYAMHFAPNAVPTMHFNPAALGAMPSVMINGHNYGEHIGVLSVHRFNRTINIIAGATMESMDYGAGHFSNTGLNFGNTALIGHNRGSRNGFFDFVRHLQYGDIITLEAGGITRQYVMSIRLIVHETDLDSLMQFGDNRLTLITCVEYQRSQRRVAILLEKNY